MHIVHSLLLISKHVHTHTLFKCTFRHKMTTFFLSLCLCLWEQLNLSLRFYSGLKNREMVCVQKHWHWVCFTTAGDCTFGCGYVCARVTTKTVLTFLLILFIEWLYIPVRFCEAANASACFVSAVFSSIPPHLFFFCYRKIDQNPYFI